MAIATVNSLSRPSIPAPRLPDPNGYLDLERAGSMIHGAWPKGNLAEVKSFVEANRASLDLARLGLTRESVIPLENSQEGLSRHFESWNRVRSVTRLFQGKEMVAQSEGRFADAARICRDSLALGQAMTQGGMGNDVAVGWMIQSMAITQLRKIRDRLSVETCRSILRDLESLDDRRVPLDAVHDRWAAFYQGSHNLFQRTQLRWSGIEKSGEQAEMAMAKKGRDKVERDMHFFMVELAIHAHHLDKGTWPRTVQELVPDYLQTAPIDPSTGKPVDYPANPQGELTDDLGSIARPDGEVVPQP